MANVFSSVAGINSMGQAIAPAPEAEIPSMVSGLSNDLHALYDSFSQLVQRLGPVRRVPVPQEAKVGAPVPSFDTQTPLGNDLADMRRNVASMRASLAMAMHELELP